MKNSPKYHKVQTVGINKDYLIKIHKELIMDIMMRGTKLESDFLDEVSKMCVIQAGVYLFGLSELPEKQNNFTRSILARFPTGYKGINQLINENPNQQDYSEMLLNILRDTEQFITRSLSDVTFTEEETAYLAIILALDQFLENYFQTVLIPRLLAIEDQIKKEIKDIYSKTELTEEEIIAEVEKYLDEQITEINTEYQNEYEPMFTEAIKKAGEVVVLLGLTQVGLSPHQKMVAYAYMSNIKAFFFNETRKIKEANYENILSGANKRSVATQQIETVSFNKNIYKLSTVTHARALFRAIIDSSSPPDSYFKALISPLNFDEINPTGKSAMAVFQIKTRAEWSDFVDNKNANVVGGLGLHHNDLVYYYPIDNTLTNQDLAKKQKAQFTSLTKG